MLDPACGSGSFLIGAYQFLLEWHRDWYAGHDPAKFPKDVYAAKDGWRLTTARRKEILTGNIFGVDIDPQAVEVTKLSLLLKVLEGENRETLARQKMLFHERALPDLGDNIKCGNSLIGPDFYNGHQLSLFDADEQYRINAFDWHAEFAPIMKSGGFDAVIGNPPYVNIRITTQQQGEKVKDYFKQTYRCADRGYDLYVLFVERSYSLLREDGHWGMIVPNKIATLEYGEKCRELLLRKTTIENIVDLSDHRVFTGASVYPYIIVWQKMFPPDKHRISVLCAKTPEDIENTISLYEVRQRDLDAAKGLALHGVLDVESRVATSPLSERARLHSGTTGFAAEQMANAITEGGTKRRDGYFDFIVSGNIDRFVVNLGSVRFMKRSFARPVLARHHPILSDNKQRMYDEPKIVIAGMTKRLEAALDDVGLALGVQVFAAAELKDDPRYVLGLLNSSLLSFLFRMRFQAKHLAGGYLAINLGQLAQLPIRLIDTTIRTDNSRHDRVVELVKRMLEFHRQLPKANTDQAKMVIQRQIATTDRQIDNLVYELYGLSDAEIALVEQATG